MLVFRGESKHGDAAAYVTKKWLAQQPFCPRSLPWSHPLWRGMASAERKGLLDAVVRTYQCHHLQIVSPQAGLRHRPHGLQITDFCEHKRSASVRDTPHRQQGSIYSLRGGGFTPSNQAADSLWNCYWISPRNVGHKNHLIPQKNPRLRVMSASACESSWGIMQLPKSSFLSIPCGLNSLSKNTFGSTQAKCQRTSSTLCWLFPKCSTNPTSFITLKSWLFSHSHRLLQEYHLKCFFKC